MKGGHYERFRLCKGFDWKNLVFWICTWCPIGGDLLHGGSTVCVALIFVTNM